MDFRVATDILRKEAGTWDQQADQMAAARSKVDAMELGLIEAGVFMPIVSSYNDLVRDLRSRSDEAVTAMHQVGETLRQVADKYERADEAAARRASNIS
jgi:uncharacterized protein YukE